MQISNPFPGPQPYRDSDRCRFYGREDLSCALVDSILASRCITVYGPSGAGKSSLVQASVLPALIELHKARVVRVDSWPEGEEPTRWLAAAMKRSLRLGEQPDDASPPHAVLSAVQRAARRSPRLVVIYLDQIEQLLYSRRQAAEADLFFDCINSLADMPLRNLRMVLSLREDYLGRFRDLLRDHRRLLDNGFRVGPLTVAELCEAVRKAAASGEPPQQWSPSQTRTLMLQVRTPGQAESDEAEAQAAYAQIVCRALFQERAVAGDDRASGWAADCDAEPILRRYFEATLRELGPMRDLAQRLLEWSADGRLEATWKTGEEFVRNMAFSPDGKRLVTTSLWKGPARVWSVDKAGEEITLNKAVNQVTAVAWSPDSEVFVTATSFGDDKVRVFKKDGQENQKPFDGFMGMDLTAAFSPDGKHIAIAGTDTIVRILHMDGSERTELFRNTHTESITSAVWIEGGTRIATASTDRTIRVWKVAEAERAYPIVLKASWPVLALGFKEDEKELYAITTNNTMETWLLDVDKLGSSLKEANVDCMPPEMRQQFLDESQDTAREGYEECERGYERTPFFK